MLPTCAVIYSTILSYIPDYCLSKELDHSGGHDIFILYFKCECEKLTSSHNKVILDGCHTCVTCIFTKKSIFKEEKCW